MYPEVSGLDADPEALADRAGVALEPDDADALRTAAAFRRDRMALQHEQEARLDERLPLPQVHLPFVFTAGLGASEIGQLAEELERGLRASRHDGSA